MKFPTKHHVRFLERMLPVRFDNEIVVVLTGHLLVEELLVAAVGKFFPRPEKLNCRGFHDYLCVARALGKPALTGRLLDQAEALNRLRNQLAHNLDETKYQERRKEFLSYRSEPCPDALRKEMGELWVEIMGLHARFIIAVEYEAKALRLPSLLSPTPDKEAEPDSRGNVG